jgi:hypothetical protein
MVRKRQEAAGKHQIARITWQDNASLMSVMGFGDKLPEPDNAGGMA